MSAGTGSASYRQPSPPTPEPPPLKLPSWEDMLAQHIEQETGVLGTVRYMHQLGIVSVNELRTMVWEGNGLCVGMRLPPMPSQGGRTEALTMTNAVRVALAELPDRLGEVPERLTGDLDRRR